MVRVKLALWYNEIEEFGYDTFTTVANSIENHYERILNYFVNRRTNAAAEAFNAKIKAFKASFCGVVDKRFFLYGLQRSMHKGELAKINPPRIRLSGNFWLLSFKISYLCLPLFYETRTTPSCHPSGCAYRQL